MKKAFIVTSTIDVDNDNPLTYSNIRSIFSNDQRLQQTVFTVASLDLIGDSDTTIFLVDPSDNPDRYKNLFKYQKNLFYVSIKNEFPEIFNLCRTHPNKSFCESLILINFIEKYKNILEYHDYIFKLSGRYFTDSSFDITIFNQDNRSKLFFKRPLEFEWNNEWPFHMVDQRERQGNNKLYQYSSVLYGYSKEYLDRMLDIYRVISVFTNHPDGIKYDVETLLYFFTNQYRQDVIETDWKVYGWQGVDGTFLRY